MFDAPISANIRDVRGKVTEDGDLVLRRIRLQLERTFSPEVAEALGSSATLTLSELEERGIEKVVLPIGAIKASLQLKGDDKKSVTIQQVTGLKAVGILPKAGGRDENDDTA